MEPQIGIINEIGDMSLGFDPLNEKDQKIYQESLKAEQQTKENQNK